MSLITVLTTKAVILLRPTLTAAHKVLMLIIVINVRKERFWRAVGIRAWPFTISFIDRRSKTSGSTFYHEIFS